MKISYGAPTSRTRVPCVVAMDEFDGVHRGHQAMLAVLRSEAQRRGLASCAVLLEPRVGALHAGAARVSPLRDKLVQLEASGIDHCVVLPADSVVGRLSPHAFIDRVLIAGVHARHVLVGSELRFGHAGSGDPSLLASVGTWKGFEVARMKGYELNGAQVSSAAVRHALATGDLVTATTLLGRRYALSGHVVHGRKLGRVLGFPTLNQRVGCGTLAAKGIFIARVLGLGPKPLPGVANLGVRPSLDPTDINGGRVLLETHCLEWPADLGKEGAYGKVVQVELLHKLHDELKYPSLEALQDGIGRDRDQALAFFRAEQQVVPARSPPIIRVPADRRAGQLCAADAMGEAE